MKKKLKNIIKIQIYTIFILTLTGSWLLGCGNAAGNAAVQEDSSLTQSEKRSTEPEQTAETGLKYETARDGYIDFAALQEENPDVFAWLYIPGTNIDMPVLQSSREDDYYAGHLMDGSQGGAGALYTEMANLMNMCDFNTIIHGKDLTATDLFHELHQFENPDFFSEHNSFYIYLPDNVLTYEIFAAYYDEASDILRRYDYTTYAGCQSFLTKLYETRDMGRNIREGWGEVNPYHFLVTLNGSIRQAEQRQYVVIGALTGDAAGKIDRVIWE